MEVEQKEAEEASITKEEFKEWYNSTITQFILSKLTSERDRWMFYMANGNTIRKDSEWTTDFVVGRIQGLNDFLLVQYEEDKAEKIAKERENYAY